MSWIEQSTKDFIITTGDGKQYRPLWKNPSYTLDFNTSEFDFPEVPGTLVERSQARGKRYPFTVYYSKPETLTYQLKINVTGSYPIRITGV